MGAIEAILTRRSIRKYTDADWENVYLDRWGTRSR